MDILLDEFQVNRYSAWGVNLDTKITVHACGAVTCNKQRWPLVISIPLDFDLSDQALQPSIFLSIHPSITDCPVSAVPLRQSWNQPVYEMTTVQLRSGDAT
ncbi:hypothetical protein PoB_006514700 [Plakobranchus ocellatus]|uniref:Uncharacterized protein n=1 Tax=Plakobranchus ocellatus TaxID=259542 RepID=A0AAV4D386_9GAST|nr:hypothetical protein PoB_006514700 [Plakobranchus ocellatus]